MKYKPEQGRKRVRVSHHNGGEKGKEEALPGPRAWQNRASDRGNKHGLTQNVSARNIGPER